VGREYSIDCPLNDEYEARVQIGVGLPYDRHDDEIDGDGDVDVGR